MLPINQPQSARSRPLTAATVAPLLPVDRDGNDCVRAQFAPQPSISNRNECQNAFRDAVPTPRSNNVACSHNACQSSIAMPTAPAYTPFNLIPHPAVTPNVTNVNVNTQNQNSQHSETSIQRANHRPFAHTQCVNKSQSGMSIATAVRVHQREHEHAEQKSSNQESDSVQLARTIARLSLLVMQQCTVNKREIASKLLRSNAIDNLYRAMFRYPEQPVLQQEIKDALNALQAYLAHSNQHETRVSHTPCRQSQSHSHSDEMDARKPIATCTRTQTLMTNSTRRCRSNASNPFIKRRVDLGVYECTECRKQYKHLCNLRSHSKVHTDQAYRCEFCGKKFGRKTNWKEHIRVHTGEHPFQCSVCQKAFKQKHALKEHQLKKHSGI